MAKGDDTTTEDNFRRNVAAIARGTNYTLMLKDDNQSVMAYGTSASVGTLNGTGVNADIISGGAVVGGDSFIPDGTSLYITGVSANGSASALVGNLLMGDTITAHAAVYAWGDNGSNAMGAVGGAATLTVPTALFSGYNSQEYVANTSNIMDRVTMIAFGRDHTAMVRYDGTVWVAGSNVYGQRGDQYPYGQYKASGRATRVGDESMKTLVFEAEDGGKILTGNNDRFLDLTEGQSVTTSIMRGRVPGFNLYKVYELAPVEDASGLIYGSSDPRLVTVSETGVITANESGIYGRAIVWAYDPADGSMGMLTVTVLQDEAGVIAAPMATSGLNFSVALKADGTVWTWGDNTYCQLGRGYTGNDANGLYALPGQVLTAVGTPLTGIVYIAAGAYHSIAVDKDGRVWTWGYNGEGQLGRGNTSNSAYAIQVGGLLAGVKVVEAAAGERHSLVLTESGAVYAFGQNNRGQLGDTSETNRTVPVAVRGPLGGSNDAPQLDQVVSLAAGTATSAALRMDGSVVVWGYNNVGQSGMGISHASYTLVTPNYVTRENTAVVTSHDRYLRGATDLAAGGAFFLTIQRDGTVFSWGDNQYGTANTDEPLLVSGTGAWGDTLPVDVSAYGTHAYVTDSNSLTYAFGVNSTGTAKSQMGLPHTVETATAPSILVKNAGTGRTDVDYYFTDTDSTVMDHILTVAPGGSHLVVVREDGTLFAVGLNNYGQLGSYVTNAYGDETDAAANDNPANRYYLFRVGAEDSYSLSLNGALTITGTAENQGAVPQEGKISYVTLREGQSLTVDLSLATLAYTSGFRLYNEEMSEDGSVKILATAFNAYSGNENVAKAAVSGNTVTITPVPGGYGETNILIEAVGNDLTGGVSEYGMIHVTVLQDDAGKVAAPQIASGDNFTLALKSDGTVWAWGRNNYGQLGNGEATDRTVPVQVMTGEGQALTDVIAVAAGGSFGMALKTDGTVWTWGANTSGQLGNGKTATTANSYAAQVILQDAIPGTPGTGEDDPGTPDTPAVPLAGIVAVAAGKNFALALTDEGNVYMWGDNTQRQSGNLSNTTGSITRPILVQAGATAAGVSQSGSITLNAAGEALRDVIDIVAGDYHALAIRENGTVAAWGGNSDCRTGSEDTEHTTRYPNLTTAGQAGTLSDDRYLKEVLAVAAGGAYSLYETSEHKALLSGLRYDRTGTAAPAVQRPAYVTSAGTALENVNALSAGTTHAALVLGTAADGTSQVWAWGLNKSGQLGQNYYTGQQELEADKSLEPVRVYDTVLPMGNLPEYIQDVVAVDGGNGHTVFYKEDGSVFVVGSNQYGQLGDGSGELMATRPVQTGTSSNDAVRPVWAQVNREGGLTETYGTDYDRAVPDYFTLTVNESLVLDAAQMARFYSEGFNLYTDDEVTPLTAAQRANVSVTVDDESIGRLVESAGRYTLSSADAAKTGAVILTITYKENGEVVASSQIRVTFTDSNLTNQPMVSASATHTVALGQDGSIWVWGLNTMGQLGLGNTSFQEYPTRITLSGDFPAVVQVLAGDGFTLVLCADGSLYGAGRYVGSDQLNLVKMSYTGVTHIAAYGTKYLVLTNDGTLTMVSGATAVTASLAGLTVEQLAVSSGNAYLVRTADGLVYQGSTGSAAAPTVVDGLIGVTDIAAGKTLAAVSGGRVYTWSGLSGEIELVEGLTDVASVHVGDDYVIAVTSSGLAYGWGVHEKGQLGAGTDTRVGVDYDTTTGITRIDTPTPVLKGDTFNADAAPELQSVLTLSAAPDRVVMVRADGFVYTWGSNAGNVMGAHDVATGHIAAQSVQVGDMEARTLVVYQAVVKGEDGTVKRTYTLNTDSLTDSVLLAPMNITMEEGDTLTIEYNATRNDLLETYLSAFNLLIDSRTLSVRNADISDPGCFQWVSSDQSVATIAAAAGTAVITGAGVGSAVGVGVGAGVGEGLGVAVTSPGRAFWVAAGAFGPAGVTSTGIQPVPPR